MPYKQVNQRQYYDSFIDKDAVVSVESYNGITHCLWILRGSRKVIAKSIERLGVENEDHTVTEYYILNS